MELYHGDCLEIMKQIPDESVNLILCDLPYGTTACKWDTVIPFEPLWKQYERLLKGNGAVVLFGSEPFSSALRMSKIDWYKYDWYWNKNSTAGFVNAKLKPMNTVETISIFSRGFTANPSKNKMIYYPQGLIPFGKTVKNGNKAGKDNSYYQPSWTSDVGRVQEFTNYPRNYLEFSHKEKTKAVHPTQKPVALLEYLIKTYTKEDEIVLDNCMGSGSTGVAAVNLKRKFIGIEKDEKYFEIAKNRILETHTHK